LTPSLFLLRRLPGMGRVLRALGIGGVPAAGYFGAGWSLGTLLLLYWLETILVTLVVSLLIVRHRQATRRAGHWNAEYTVTTTRMGRRTTRTANTTFLKSFLAVMVPFTAGHGVFVAAFAFLVFPDQLGPAARVSLDAVGDGLAGIAIFLLASLLFDLRGIGQRPFGWVDRLAQRAQGRMIVTHLTIIFGAGAMAATEAPLAFLAVFVALKSLLDLGGLLSDREPKPKAARPAEASGRRPTKKEKKSFGDHYQEGLEAARAKSEANERVLPPPEIPA